ncbi:L-serine dehydratase, iron-sulfur-dependent, beta subunit [Thermanaerovibrio velox DSM 12556]|uniref:L-serine dehydratase n=1 Tax=Thermanaerovibrio velox DSM 12556 TaxID=926567 RepID=H0UPT2_9BACT|nr:L-serine ammonia-lyase, iron-sulfur-dependent subunit beta [Thermanaerovibrio velox]EHM10641.1 L-serine dehydratase, iron-sulfur-dependent, beta subunit [Thermanaerovibrio velox DSM 12556]
MALEEIVGPVMVGPSSSHTAGAVRLGNLARLCWGGEVREVDLFLRGSFAATFWGHGTDKALLAGIMGFSPSDESLKDSFRIAAERGLKYRFHAEKVDGAHPNSVRFVMRDDDKVMEVVGASLGGGAVELQEVDGFSLRASGELPTMITFHRDEPGVIAAVSAILAEAGINVASMNVHRQGRGKGAAMVLELDALPSEGVVERISRCHGAIRRLLLIPSLGEEAAR